MSLAKYSRSPIIYKQKLNKIYYNKITAPRYTDAYKIDFNVGITTICDSEIVTYKLIPQCTIYSAEELAIFKALDYAIKKKYKDIILIRSDS